MQSASDMARIGRSKISSDEAFGEPTCQHQQSDSRERGDRRLMPAGEHLPTLVTRLAIEAAMRPVVARNGLEETAGAFGPVGSLASCPE